MSETNQIDISLLDLMKIIESGSRLTRNKVDNKKVKLPEDKLETKYQKKKIKKKLKIEQKSKSISPQKKVKIDIPEPQKKCDYDNFNDQKENHFLKQLEKILNFQFNKNIGVKIDFNRLIDRRIKVVNQPKKGWLEIKNYQIQQMQNDIIQLYNKSQNISKNISDILIVTEICFIKLDKFLYEGIFQKKINLSFQDFSLSNDCIWPVQILKPINIDMNKFINFLIYDNEDQFDEQEIFSNFNKNDQILINYLGTSKYQMVHKDLLIKTKDLNFQNVLKFFQKSTKLQEIFEMYMQLSYQQNKLIRENQDYQINSSNIDKNINQICIIEKEVAAIILHKKNIQDKEMILLKNLKDLSNNWIDLQNKPLIQTDWNIPQFSQEQVCILFFNQSKIQENLRDLLQGKDLRNYVMNDQSKNKRCSICRYVIGELENQLCNNCSSVFHLMCLNKPHENHYLCNQCNNCSLCFDYFQNLNEQVQCSKCCFKFHKSCVFLRNDVNKDQKWYCESCSICNQCESKIETNQLKQNQLICHQCYQINENKEYCPICQKNWHQNQNLGEDWIFCDQCKSWAHRSCDPSLQNPLIYKEIQNSNKAYTCPLCQKNHKNNQIAQFIQIMSELDKNLFFHQPVDCSIVPLYKNIIKQPMDFKTMMEKAQKGMYYKDTVKLVSQDLRLICQNAMTFNFPKEIIYKEAYKLSVFFEEGIKFFRELLEDYLNIKNIMVRKEEFKQWIDINCYDLILEMEIGKGNGITKVLKVRKGQVSKVLVEVEGLSHLLARREVKKIETQDKISLYNYFKEQFYLKSRRQPFYFYSPKLLSIDLPLFIQLCALCNSHSNDLLLCEICQHAYHPFCLNLPYKSSFICPKCQPCAVCLNPYDLNNLQCSQCNKLYHLNCQYQNLTLLPNLSTWKCNQCFKQNYNNYHIQNYQLKRCEQCGTTDVFKDIQYPNESIFDFLMEFSVCYTCGFLQAYYKFCKICKKFANTENRCDQVSLFYLQKQEKSIKCQQCYFIYHENCVQIKDQDNWVCENCLQLTEDNEYQWIQKQQASQKICDEQMIFFNHLKNYELICQKLLGTNLQLLNFIQKNWDFFNETVFQLYYQNIEKNSRYQEILNQLCSIKNQGYKQLWNNAKNDPKLFNILSQFYSFLKVEKSITKKLHQLFSEFQEPKQEIQDQHQQNVQVQQNTAQQIIFPNRRQNEHITSLMDPYQCHFCKQFGQKLLSGRLIYALNDQFVHINCALYQDNVKENFEGYLDYFSMNKFQDNICQDCQLNNANISCQICKQFYHFPCGYMNGYYNNLKSFYCDKCKNQIKSNIIVNDFNCDRKLMIIQNTQNSLYKKYHRVGNTIILDCQSSLKNQQVIIEKLCLIKHFKQKYYFIQIQKYQNDYNVMFDILNDLNDLDQYLDKVNQEFQNKNNENKTISDYIQQTQKINNQIIIEKDIVIEQQINQQLKNHQDNDIINQIFNNDQIIDENKQIEQDIEIEQIQQNIEIEQNNDIKSQQLDYSCENIKDQQENIQNNNQSSENQSSEQFINNDNIFESGKIYKQENLQQLCQLIQQSFIQKDILIKSQELASQFLELQISDVLEIIKMNQVEENRQKFVEKKVIDFFYTKDIESFDPFERLTHFQEIFDKVPKISKDYEKINLRKELFREKEIEQKEKIGFISNILTKHSGSPSKNQKNQQWMDNLQRKLIMFYYQYLEKDCLVYVGPSKIHKYGLFAKDLIRKEEIVIEYVGEVIRNQVSDQREKTYNQMGFGDCYMFRIDPYTVIDASFKGNQARYLNHSCDPNSASMILCLNDKKVIVIYANRNIQKGEEITYDYQFETETEKLLCSCGSEFCQGRLN